MLEILVVCTAIGVGLLGGWWLRGSGSFIWASSLALPEDESTRAAAEHIRKLARNVATDVDNHRALMHQITDELHGLKKEDPAVTIDAIARLIESNEQIQQQLETAEQKLQNQAREIKCHATAALTDPLTQLANRRAFDQAMVEASEALAEQGRQAIVMLLDIDHFKRLNDTYGHQAGDKVLRDVAGVLREQIPEDNIIARHGGEEFAVVLVDCELDDALQLAEKARVAIGAVNTEFDGTQLRVTMSSGVAQLHPNETTASLIRRADEALYVSKATGRDCGHFHDGLQSVDLEQWIAAAPDAEHDTVVAPCDEVMVAAEEQFHEDLRRRIADWKASGAPLCLLLLQIDDFETIGEESGEQNAAAVLRATTLTLKASMRGMDHVGRFQDSAFCLLLPGTTLSGAIQAAERLRSTISRCELSPRYERRRFSASVMVAGAIKEEDDRQLIDRARQSFEAVRTRGRNCTYLHDGTRCLLVGAGPVSSVTAGRLKAE